MQRVATVGFLALAETGVDGAQLTLLSVIVLLLSIGLTGGWLWLLFR
jgi:hypothetical protein